jgi:creatinine amidohydrolase
MNMKTLNVEMMTWPDYQQRVDSGAVVFLPVGAHEQHGPHLPLATDAIFAQRIAERVAEQIDGIVLPVVRFGYKSQARSGGGQTFSGTISLDGITLINTVQDILRELSRHGVQQCVIVNGHFENQWFLTEAIELAQRELTAIDKNMKIVRTEYWDFTPESVYDRIFEGPFPGVDLEHAALIETSMMLFLHPELVKKENIPNNPLAQFPPHDTYPQTGQFVPDTGVLAPAGNATADKGKLLVESICENMAAAMLCEFFPDEYTC